MARERIPSGEKVSPCEISDWFAFINNSSMFASFGMFAVYSTVICGIFILHCKNIFDLTIFVSWLVSSDAKWDLVLLRRLQYVPAPFLPACALQIPDHLALAVMLEWQFRHQFRINTWQHASEQDDSNLLGMQSFPEWLP